MWGAAKISGVAWLGTAINCRGDNKCKQSNAHRLVFKATKLQTPKSRINFVVKTFSQYVY